MLFTGLLFEPIIVCVMLLIKYSLYFFSGLFGINIDFVVVFAMAEMKKAFTVLLSFLSKDESATTAKARLSNAKAQNTFVVLLWYLREVIMNL